MEFILNLSADELDHFVAEHPNGHYMKTSFWADYLANKEGYHYTLTGIKDDDRLVGTAVLLVKKTWFMTKPYIYLPTGMCLDYQNRDYLEFFIVSLIDYAKSQQAVFLRIDPNVLRCHRDILGKRIDDGYSNEWLTQYLIECGFKHKGYGYAYNGSWINRYTLMIDLEPSMEQIIAKFTKSKQNVLKRQKQMGISTRYGTEEDLPYLVAFEWELTKTQGFKPHKVAFFKDLLTGLKEYIHLYVTEVNLSVYITNLQEEIDSNKYRKDPEALTSKKQEIINARQLKAQYGEQVVIAVGMFVRYAHKSWDLYTYNRKDFNNFKATDYLHAFVIDDMKRHGVRLYDMVGFSGVTEKRDPYYGLYDYKRSFGSDFYEHIGQFDYVIDEKQYTWFNQTQYQIKRFRRKLFRILYKKDKD